MDPRSTHVRKLVNELKFLDWLGFFPWHSTLLLYTAKISGNSLGWRRVPARTHPDVPHAHNCSGRSATGNRRELMTRVSQLRLGIRPALKQ